MEEGGVRCFRECKVKSDQTTGHSWTRDFERGTNALTGKAGNRNIFVISNHSSTNVFLSLKPESSERWSKESRVYSSVREVVEQQLFEDGISFSVGAAKNYYGVDVGGKLMYSQTESTKKAKGAFAFKEKGYFREKKFASVMAVMTDANRAVLTDEFEAAVIHLKTNSSEFLKWRQLFRNFGTHYHLKAHIGVRVEFYSEWNKKETREWTSKETVACAAASGEIEAGIPVSTGIVEGSGSVGYQTCEGTGSRHRFNRRMEYFKTKSQVVGGQSDMLRCGNPETAWDRFKDTVTQYNGVTIPEEQAPIWQLLSSVKSLTAAERMEIEAKG